MSDDELTSPTSARRPASGATALCLVLLLLAPIVYLLSIGPIVALAEKTNHGKEAVVVFYAPVIWLHNHTVLKEPLEWYAELWGWK